MDNYHYIIAGLPELTRDRMPGDIDTDAVIGEIKAQCSAPDAAAIGLLERGHIADNLTEDFYREALSSRNAFIRRWFAFDLNVRNAKVRYLNAALGRESSRDVIDIRTGEFEESRQLEAVLSGSDILARERGIDDLYWAKAEELTLFHYFDIDVILGFIARLKIVDRWLKLDEDTGRQMFRELVDEVIRTVSNR